MRALKLNTKTDKNTKGLIKYIGFLIFFASLPYITYYIADFAIRTPALKLLFDDFSLATIVLGAPVFAVFACFILTMLVTIIALCKNWSKHLNQHCGSFLIPTTIFAVLAYLMFAIIFLIYPGKVNQSFISFIYSLFFTYFPIYIVILGRHIVKWIKNVTLKQDSV